MKNLGNLLFDPMVPESIIAECSFAAWQKIIPTRRKSDYLMWKEATYIPRSVDSDSSARSKDKYNQEKAWKECFAKYNLEPLARTEALPYDELNEKFSL